MSAIDLVNTARPAAITRALADPYDRRSLSAWARARRWEELLRRFPHIADMRVVDLGGDPRYWAGAPLAPAELVLVNLYEQDPPFARARCIVGDACELPPSLRHEKFDLVHSNSVIEHVGGHTQRRAFADNVHALADHHWIQTPYRYFPLEPHWLFPGFQFLPVAVRATVTQHWRVGHRRVPDRGAAVRTALSVHLLSKTEMRQYFPGSEIWQERLSGLTKSVTAVA